MSDAVRAGEILVAPEIYPLLQGADLTTFRAVMDYSGGIHICHKRGRSVYRLELGGRAFYLKRNRWHRVEFGKGLLRLKFPRREARREWKNILAVREAGIPTVVPVAMGEDSLLGMETASFLMTEELYGAEPLDAIVRRLFIPPLTTERRREKRRLIAEVAALASRLHGHGLNHQDFYLNHFFRDGNETLYLLDLQRIQKRDSVTERYRVKDLAQLDYSARCLGAFTLTDRIRFLRAYLGTTRLDAGGKALARRVSDKTRRIARHDVKLMARRRRRGELPPA